MTTDKTLQPLVSCIMPTANRRLFIPHAIHYFLCQDYPRKELIIVDDGIDSISDLVPSDKCIRYLRLSQKLTLGAKLNLACEHARGIIIAHWDDDDWYANWRLRYQVEALIRDGTAICGINDLLYYDLCTGRAYRYVYPANKRVWLSGSSLCYRKQFWHRTRFAEIDVGMDGLFVWSAPPHSITVLRDSTFSVLTIHPHNVSPKRTDGAYWHPYPVEEIQKVLGDNWGFYKADPATSLPGPRLRSAFSPGLADKTVEPVRNVHACLVHESLECVIDLVRNLKFHDPASVILLYNGGGDSELLDHDFPWEQYGVIVHPSPHPMRWGRLHEFALDCMRFALDHLPFETLTIVDSDQLAVRPGYSHYLAKFLAGHSGIGLMGNAPEPQLPTTQVDPAVVAFQEIDLWRPFLRRFPEGERKFAHWTFWPSTVITADAARDLTRLFSTDTQLQDIMQRTKIWATEEVILPTLVALLGYKIMANPCSYDYIKYRVSYILQQINAAFTRQDVFWIHPIPRRYSDDLRKHIRAKCNHYERASASWCPTSASECNTNPGLLLITPILTAMKKVEGWLDEDEADLLIAVVRQAIVALPQPHTIVEIGSYCGRSTVVLGSVAKVFCPKTKIYAIDPHDGRLGALDQGIRLEPPSLQKFQCTIQRAGLTSMVETLHSRSFEVPWDKPIGLLLIDGLHDYVNVARDFFHFEPWIVAKGYIAFHDYADYFPGVKAFVNEILGTGRYRKVHCVGSMMVVQKQPLAEASQDGLPPCLAETSGSG